MTLSLQSPLSVLKLNIMLLLLWKLLLLKLEKIETKLGSTFHFARVGKLERWGANPSAPVSTFSPSCTLAPKGFIS